MRPAEPTNPSRAPRTPPRTHIPPNPYHDPSIKYAPARRPHDFMATQHTSRPRPIPNSLRLSLCLLPLEFPDWSLGIDDDLSRMHSAYDLNFLVFFFGSAIWVRLQLPCDTLYTVQQQHFISPQIPFVDTCFPCYNIVVLCRLPESRSYRPRYHRDGMARVVVGLFRSSNLLQSPYHYFYRL